MDSSYFDNLIITVTDTFLINSLLLGVGLAMDAFSVSVATGLAQPDMKKGRLVAIPAVFGIFQLVMPLIGWLCVHTAVEHFRVLEKLIPWIALLLLGFIGGKMLIESAKGGEEQSSVVSGFKSLLILGIATSIDALSVGFTIADYDLRAAAACSAVIGAVTFIICLAGILLGRKIGEKLAGKAGMVGGVILIVIGIEIFIKGVIK